MCIHCEEKKEKQAAVLSRANDFAELAMLATGGVHDLNSAFRLKTQLEKMSDQGMLEVMNLLLLIAHFARQSKSLEDDNNRLREALDYLSVKQTATQSASKQVTPVESLRIIESLVDTFENAQARAMEGANAQIRELKNRYGLNK